MLAFSEALPKIREQLERDLGRPGLPREKVLATVVRLLESTCIRVGNDEYAKANRSYGLTTLQDRHVRSPARTPVRVPGQERRGPSVDLTTGGSRESYSVVRRCRVRISSSTRTMMAAAQTIGSGDVNDYIREISGEEFTAKDFRTWAGTLLAVAALDRGGRVTTQRQAKSNVLEAIDRVAEQLNNTRAVCRKYYVHPAVFETYLAGTLVDALQNGTKEAAKSRWRPRKPRWCGCFAVTSTPQPPAESTTMRRLCRGIAAPASPQ